jgi:hypothetical protein
MHGPQASTGRTSPQPVVAKVLSLLGVDQILTVRDQAGTPRT